MASARIQHVIDTLLAGRDDNAESPLTLQLCRAAVQELAITGAGIALINESGHQGVVAATDGLAAALEDLQFSLSEGPSIDAFTDRRPVLRPDLVRRMDHWPGFADGAVAAGAGAIFAFPLQVGGIRIGALGLYRSTPGDLDNDQLSGALDFADAAIAILLRNESHQSAHDYPHASLYAAGRDPAEVHQATGVISVQAAIGLTEALLLLRAHAYATERPLVDAARDVLAHRLRFAPEDDHHE